MAVVRFPFRGSASRQTPTEVCPDEAQHRIRAMLDRLQVLFLEKPAVALWFMDWMDRFLAYHTD